MKKIEQFLEQQDGLQLRFTCTNLQVEPVQLCHQKDRKSWKSTDREVVMRGSHKEERPLELHTPLLVDCFDTSLVERKTSP